MSSNTSSPAADTDEAKGAFRKPANEAASRKYRRRSPASRSVSPDGSSKQDLRSSPTSLKDDKRRKHNNRDDRESGRGDHEHDSDSRRYSSKDSQGYNRSSTHSRGGKYADEEDRNYSRLSSRSGRDPKRSRDYYHHKDKYSRDRSDAAVRASRDKYDDRDRHGRDRDYRDDKRDYGRSSRDYKSDRICEESRADQDDTISRRESSGQKEPDKNDRNAENRSKHLNEGIKKYDERDSKDSREKLKDDAPDRRKEETAVKRKTLFSSESNDLITGSNQGRDLPGKDTLGHGVNMTETVGTLDAAKVAAMKAAELVNKNLIGTGVMTADQKKKLLWGNKKNTVTEESSSHRWDTAIFPDRERQEKFNKLMGVKGEVKVALNPDSDPVQSEKQRELQMDLEKQYTAGLRRRDGRTVGLGL